MKTKMKKIKTIILLFLMLFISCNFFLNTSKINAADCETSGDCPVFQWCYKNKCLDSSSIGGVCSPNITISCKPGLECLMDSKSNNHICMESGLSEKEISINIVNWILFFILAVSVCAIFYGAIKYFLAKNNDKRKHKAKKIIICGVVGTIIIWFIINIVIETGPNPIFS